MINEYIKKIVFILLLALLVYVVILVSPKIMSVLTTIVSIILPFIIAFVLAFALNPIVLKIEQKVKNRKLSIIIVLLGIVLILGSFLVYTIPKVKKEFLEFQDTIPTIIEYIKSLLNRINEYINKLFNSQKALEEINIENKLSTFFNSFMNIGNNVAKNLIYFLSSLFIIPILTVYFLNDYDNIVAFLKGFLINKKRERFLNYLLELSSTMRTYIKGVLVVMLILFVLFSIAFSFLKIPYALVFALFLAITNIIPYFGAYIGAILPVLFALSDSYLKAIITIGVCVVVQAIEANIITPMIQKKYNKINPLYSILSLLVFSRLFGFLGMIIAIPMVNVIKITLKHYPIKFLGVNNK